MMNQTDKAKLLWHAAKAMGLNAYIVYNDENNRPAIISGATPEEIARVMYNIADHCVGDIGKEPA